MQLFFMINMASDMDRGCVCATMTMTMNNNVQHGSQTPANAMQPWFTVSLILDIHVMVN